MRIAKDTAADAQDHRTMPLHQRFRGRLIVLFDEERQELPIRQASPVADKHRFAKLLDDGLQAAGPHFPSSRAPAWRIRYLLFLGGGRFHTLFCVIGPAPNRHQPIFRLGADLLEYGL